LCDPASSEPGTAFSSDSFFARPISPGVKSANSYTPDIKLNN